MHIGLIDADLLGRKNHRFPNLALMKISSYYKNLGYDAQLLRSYDNLQKLRQIFLSCCFSDSKIPIDSNNIPNLECGGSAFSSSEDLPTDIEHSKPDYTLYNDWVSSQNGNPRKYKFYTDYSIGYLTRGCFRKCEFCINKKYDKVQINSNINEFLDNNRKKICLLDDNFLAYPDHQELLQSLIDTGKRFTFKQGLDLRILKEETANMLANSKYDEDYIFAFDNIEDYNLIEKKLELWRSITHRNTRLYVLVAHKSQDVEDIVNMFERIKLLIKYNCTPYIMRYNYYKASPFRSLYTNVARWCNQSSLFKRMSFREFCFAHGETHGVYRRMVEFERKYPELREYLDMKFTKRS